MKLKNGCPGCNLSWDGPDNKEGQCYRCKRCLECCGRVVVKFSCAWRYQNRVSKDPGYAFRSAKAYERWINNLAVLGHNRRII